MLQYMLSLNSIFIKFLSWAYINVKKYINNNYHFTILIFTIIVVIHNVINTFYRFYPPESVSDKIANQLLAEYQNLSPDLTRGPDPCDKDDLKRYNQAKIIQQELAAFAPYTSNPNIYKSFLINTTPIIVYTGECTKNNSLLFTKFTAKHN